MSQFFTIHSEDPQQRLIRHAAEIIRADGVVVYPTDSAYALGCHIGNKAAVDRIRAIRQLDKHHNFTLVCQDLSQLSTYARVSNQTYRALKTLTPGPFTFILEGTNEVPRRLIHPKRKTIGLRVPDNAIAQALLAALGEPMMSASLIMPGEELPLTDPYEVRDRLEAHVDLIIDGGYCGLEPSTVIDFTGTLPVLARQGQGDASAILP